LWWCCGKNKKDANGCKIGKHESKDDEEDEAADPNAKEENQKNQKNVLFFPLEKNLLLCLKIPIIFCMVFYIERDEDFV
jgi:hypothetical protein